MVPKVGYFYDTKGRFFQGRRPIEESIFAVAAYFDFVLIDACSV